VEVREDVTPGILGSVKEDYKLKIVIAITTRYLVHRGKHSFDPVIIGFLSSLLLLRWANGTGCVWRSTWTSRSQPSTLNHSSHRFKDS
jgi:hypothetical protein